MKKFIEVTYEDGSNAFINLNWVMSIREENNRYVLSLVNSKCYVPIDCKEVMELIVKD